MMSILWKLLKLLSAHSKLISCTYVEGVVDIDGRKFLFVSLGFRDLVLLFSWVGCPDGYAETGLEAPTNSLSS